MKKQILTAAMLLSSAMSFGAGYQLNLQGLRQLAMGGSGTAWPWDASTIFYNPGGLSRLKHFEVNGSLLFINPSVAYAQRDNGTGTGTYTANTQAQTFTPFNVYLGGPLMKGSKFGIGIGIYTPFGSGLKWDDNWTGKYMVQSIELQSIFIQPTVSYAFNDVVSVGAGFIYAIGNLDYKLGLPVQDTFGNDGRARLKGSANGLGFNVGVQLKASDKIQFGITYRSQVNMKINGGNATFTVPQSLTSNFPNTKFKSELPLPQVFSVGVGIRPVPRLTLQLDVNVTGWSAYDSLKFDFNEHTSSLQNIHAPRRYKNTATVRVGGHYRFGKIAVMAGAAYDPSPTRDGYVSPELPDADRTVLTCGLTYKPVKKLTLMAAFEYTVTAKRDADYYFDNFSGRYQTKAVTPGIGLSYDF